MTPDDLCPRHREVYDRLAQAVPATASRILADYATRCPDCGRHTEETTP